MSAEQAALGRLFDAIATREDAKALALLRAKPELARAATGTGDERFLAAVRCQIYAGDTALHVAAAAYRADMVRSLITMGADVRARNRRGTSPLHHASVGAPEADHWDPEAQMATIAALVAAGADPNATNKDGVAPLHRAVRARCAAAVKALLAAGADPRRPNGNGSTPMLLATRETGRGGSGSPAAKVEQAEIIRLLSGATGRPSPPRRAG